MLCNTRDLTANVYMCKCVCLPEYLIQMGTFYVIIKMSSYPISSTEAQMLSVRERACVPLHCLFYSYQPEAQA